MRRGIKLYIFIIGVIFIAFGPSIGLAEYEQSDGMDFDPFIHRADEAMYAAKKIKGNAIIRYSELHSAI